MIVLAATIVAVAIVGVVAWLHLSSVVRRRRKLPFLVTLKSGIGFKGVLITDDSRALVLGNVEAIEDGKPFKVDGEVIVPWGDVKYMQRL